MSDIAGVLTGVGNLLAPQALVPEATKDLKARVAGCHALKTQLNAADFDLLTLMCPGFSMRVGPPSGASSQHGFAAASREVARSVAEGYCHFETEGHSVCVIGATGAEVSKWYTYDGKPTQRRNGATQTTAEVHFLIHGSESKDLVRIGDTATTIVAEMPPEVKTVMLRKHRDFKRFSPGDAMSMAKELRMVVDAAKAGGPRGRIHLRGDVPAVDMLYFPDVGYGMEQEEWVDYFARSGARCGIAYMFVPDELFFKDMVRHDRYRYVEQGSHAHVTWVGCAGSGYYHRRSTWGLLSTRHFLRGRDGAVVQVEVLGQYGCCKLFKLWPVKGEVDLTAIRRLSVPEPLRYVRVLDFEASFSRGVLGPLKYFSAREAEVFQVYNHLLSVKEEGLRFTYAMSYCNKMRNGILYGGKTQVGAWHAEASDIKRLALALFIASTMEVARHSEITKALSLNESQWSRFMALFRRGAIAFATLGMSELIRLVSDNDLRNRIIVGPDQEALCFERLRLRNPVDPDWGVLDDLEGSAASDVARSASCETSCSASTSRSASSGSSGGSSTVDGTVTAFDRAIADFESAEAAPREDCEWCVRLKGRLGEQRVVCKHCASFHDFHLRDGAYERIKNRLDAEIESGSQCASLLLKVKDRLRELNAAYGEEAKDSAEGAYRCEVRVIVAPPGCGKTHAIIESTTLQDGIVCPLRDLRDQVAASGIMRCEGDAPCTAFRCAPGCCRSRDVAKAGQVMTHDIAITNMGHVDVLRVDEAPSMDADRILMLVLAVRPRVLEIYGDEKQYRCFEAHGTDVVDFFGEGKWKSLSRHYLCVNFRNPPSIVRWMNEQYKYDPPMLSRSTYEGPAVRIVSVADPLYERAMLTSQPFMALTLKEAETAGFKPTDRTTVRSNQGRTMETATFMVTRDAIRHAAKDPGMLVGMSRCKGTVTVVHDGTAEAKGLLAQYGVDADNFSDLITCIGGAPGAADVLKDQSDMSEEALPVAGNSDDAYKTALELIPGSVRVNGAEPLNVPASQAFLETCEKARVDVDGLLAPLSSGGMPKPLSQTADIMAHTGNVYAQGDPSQTLNVATKRHGQESKPMPADGGQMAMRVMEKYARFCFKNRRVDPGEHDLQAIEQAVFSDFRKKGADAAVNGKEITEHDMRAVVRFHLKTILKPATGKPLEKIDQEKVGQGISAWAKEPTLIFAILARYVERWSVLNQRKDDFERGGQMYVATDDMVPDEDFITEVVSTARKLKTSVPSAMWRTTDGVMFDSQQNEFTKEVERCLWRHIGIEEDTILGYYAYRSAYLMCGDGFTLRASHQKTSGEPWTKGGNGWVARALSFYVLSLKGPQLIVYKGDDFANLGVGGVDEKALAEMRHYTDLVIRVNEEVPFGEKYMPDFCGLSLHEGYLFPSIVRRFLTAFGKRYAGYEHFALYQESLRSFVKLIRKLSECPVTPAAADAARLRIPDAVVHDMLEGLNSLSHINREQYDAIVMEHTLVPSWFGIAGDGQPVWVYGSDVDPQGRRRGDEELGRLMTRLRQESAAAKRKGAGGTDADSAARAAVAAAASARWGRSLAPIGR